MRRIRDDDGLAVQAVLPMKPEAGMGLRETVPYPLLFYCYTSLNVTGSVYLTRTGLPF